MIWYRKHLYSHIYLLPIHAIYYVPFLFSLSHTLTWFRILDNHHWMLAFHNHVGIRWQLHTIVWVNNYSLNGGSKVIRYCQGTVGVLLTACNEPWPEVTALIWIENNRGQWHMPLDRMCTCFFKNRFTQQEWLPSSLQSWGGRRRWERREAPHLSRTIAVQVCSNSHFLAHSSVQKQPSPFHIHCTHITLMSRSR